MYWSLPHKGNLLDEADGLHTRTANPIEEVRPVHKGLGRRLVPSTNFFF
jgi:hypothetical protein